VSDADSRTDAQIAVDFVRAAGRPVSLSEIAAHLEQLGRNPNRSRLDVACYCVNVNSRAQDVVDNTRQLFRLADGTFVPCDPGPSDTRCVEN
jgi:hypothetical protein